MRRVVIIVFLFMILSIYGDRVPERRRSSERAVPVYLKRILSHVDRSFAGSGRNFLPETNLLPLCRAWPACRAKRSIVEPCSGDRTAGKPSLHNAVSLELRDFNHKPSVRNLLISAMGRPVI